jgi:uncharacterized protein (DUF2062 family)
MRAFVRRLLDAHATPGRLAFAVFVGVVLGSTPLFGFHFLLCIAVAWLLRLNQVTVYMAANISVPPMVPLLGYASVEVGERLLHGRWLPLAVADFRSTPLPALLGRFYVDWLVGGLVVGSAIGVVLASGVYVLARRRQRRAAEPLYRLIVESARRYAGAPRPLRVYAWFKYRLDPSYRRIVPLIPEESLTVDLGTGLGMLPVALGLLGGGRRAIGVDWDEAKLAAGRLAGAGLEGIELVVGDLRTFELPVCDAITLVDVLHYYSAEIQREILARSAAALRPGGQLLIREGDTRAGRTAAWTRGLEALAVRLGWNRGEGTTRFRAITLLVEELRALGLEVEHEAAAGKLHPGNVLIRARRSGPHGSSQPMGHITLDRR